MPTKPTPPAADPLALTVRLTPQMRADLEKLLASGYYGWTLVEAAERLLAGAIEGRRGR